MPDKLPRGIREYLAKIGQKGGEARGKVKQRGDSEHYRKLARKRWGKSGTDPAERDGQ